MKTLPWSFAVVIGASSGIGESVARRLADAGVRVALVARRHDTLHRVAAEINELAGRELAFALAHDVGQTDDVDDVLQAAALMLGGLDLLVYSAGVMPAESDTIFSTQTDVHTISVNLAGAIAWMNAAATRFVVQRRGVIVGISSVAGERGRGGNLVYSATKAGLNTYMEGLRCRIARSGVRVVTIKPGYVRTPLIAHLKKGLPALDPDRAAEMILAAASAGQREVFVPFWWRWIMLGIKLMPAGLLERVRIQ